MASLKNTIINDTGNLTLPVGSTGQRPSVATGQTRFNSSLGLMEYYNGSTWVQTADQRDGSTPARCIFSIRDFDLLKKPAGNYYFGYTNGTVQTTPTTFYAEYSGYNFNNTGFGWFLGFQSPYNSTATTNFLNSSISWTQIMVRRTDNVFWETAGFNGVASFNTRNDTNTMTTGTRSGYRVFFGYPGGMGIYTTGQNPCSWGDAPGAIGAGWDGSSCGGFPNSLLWGTGQSGTATYANMSGTWQIWLRW